RVVSNFIIQALRGSDLTVYGCGAQSRSFCYVDDIVKGLILMMDSAEGFSGPVNMGNPQEVQIEALAQTIISLCNSKSRIVYKALPEADPRRRCPDVTLAYEKLGWRPQISLIDGLMKTIDFYRHIVNRKT